MLSENPSGISGRYNALSERGRFGGLTWSYVTSASSARASVRDRCGKRSLAWMMLFISLMVLVSSETSFRSSVSWVSQLQEVGFRRGLVLVLDCWSFSATDRRTCRIGGWESESDIGGEASGL